MSFVENAAAISTLIYSKQCQTHCISYFKKDSINRRKTQKFIPHNRRANWVKKVTQ